MGHASMELLCVASSSVLTLGAEQAPPGSGFEDTSVTCEDHAVALLLVFRAEMEGFEPSRGLNLNPLSRSSDPRSSTFGRCCQASLRRATRSANGSGRWQLRLDLRLRRLTRIPVDHVEEGAFQHASSAIASIRQFLRSD